MTAMKRNITQKLTQPMHPINSPTNKSRQRVYEATGLNIQLYRKKPKLKTTELLSNDDPRRKQYKQKSVSKNNWKLDMSWVLGFNVTTDKPTPLWPGWNAKISEALQYIPKIGHLPQINQSPTNHSVLAETMRRSLETAAKAQKTSTAVTYDLATAKIAMQIKHEETLKYDGVFIALGSFHIEMVFFKVLGKLIAESEGPYILKECVISIKSLISRLTH